MVLIEVLIVVALFAIATIALLSWLLPRPPAVTGAAAPLGNPVPGMTGVTGEWAQRFPNLETGTTYHFIYKLTRQSGGTSTSLSNITVSFSAGPAGHVVIESVNGYSATSAGSALVATSVSGTVDVHLKAVSLPDDFQGAIVAIPSGAPLSVATAPFEITEP